MTAELRDSLAQVQELSYFVDGQQVSRKYAVAAWLNSKTYKLANPKTRDQIWRDAENGIDRDGVRNHLSEAGIRVVAGTHGPELMKMLEGKDG